VSSCVGHVAPRPGVVAEFAVSLACRSELSGVSIREDGVGHRSMSTRGRCMAIRSVCWATRRRRWV
jgi:hypothetical protein